MRDATTRQRLLAKALRLHARELVEPGGTNATDLRRNLVEAADALEASDTVAAAPLEEIASDLWCELCEGEGVHSEALDKGLILKHLRRAVAAAPQPKMCATCRHWDCPTDGTGSWCQRPKSPMEFMSAPGDFGCSLHEAVPAADARAE